MYMLLGAVCGAVVAALLALFFVRTVESKAFRIFLLILDFVGCISFGSSCSGYLDSWANIDKGIDDKIAAIEKEAQKYGAGLMDFTIADIAKLDTAIVTAIDRTKESSFHVDRELTKILKSQVSASIILCLPQMIGRAESGEPILIKDAKVNMHDVLILAKASTIPVIKPIIKQRGIILTVCGGVFIIAVILCSIVSKISSALDEDDEDDDEEGDGGDKKSGDKGTSGKSTSTKAASNESNAKKE